MTVKLTIQNRQAAVSVVPTASSLIIRALKEPPRDRKKEKNIKHNKSVSLDEIIDIARTMRFKSFSKSLQGVVLEILGTAFSVGCQVDGKSPKAVQEAIHAGEIDSTFKSRIEAPVPCLWRLARCWAGTGTEMPMMLTRRYSSGRVKRQPPEGLVWGIWHVVRSSGLALTMLARLRQINSMKRSWPRLCLMACCWRFVDLPRNPPQMRLKSPSPSPMLHLAFTRTRPISPWSCSVHFTLPRKIKSSSNYSPRLPLASAVEVEVHILGRHLFLHKLDCLLQQSHLGQTRRPDLTPCTMLVTVARIRNDVGDVWLGRDTARGSDSATSPWSQAGLAGTRKAAFVAQRLERVYKHLS